LTEIAHASEYESLSHFNRQFQKVSGTDPKAFRQQQQF
jgi:AraC-like DNA-binding protein